MGRKKRKIEASDGPVDPTDGTIGINSDETIEDTIKKADNSGDPAADGDDKKKQDSSSYAVTSHSADIITEDIYISDGSVDSEEEADDTMQLVLTGSKTGLMRRGLHSLQQHQQPDRVWTRKAHQQELSDATPSQEELGEDEKRRQEEEELAKLDPAERAARLLQEKQRREAEAKLEARRKENEENVSKDPLLFSKRTAFDIRFEQIEDKPWQRVEGNTHFTEFFNYDLQEDDWLEYAQQQLAIRQELIDASKQKRAPDPSIVPIQPRKSIVVDTEAATVVAAPQPNEEVTSSSDPEPTSSSTALVAPVKEIEDAGLGGAWGAGAAAGTVLAKLIEEQEMREANPDRFQDKPSPADYPPPEESYPPPPPASSHYARPPPVDRGYRGRPPPHGRGGYRGGGGGGGRSYDAYGDSSWKRPREDYRGRYR